MSPTHWQSRRFWGWWLAPRSGRFTPRKDPVPIVQGLKLYMTYLTEHTMRYGDFPINVISDPKKQQRSVVLWSEFLARDTEVSGSIPGATRFSE